jgi:hypothetical protein
VERIRTPGWLWLFRNTIEPVIAKALEMLRLPGLPLRYFVAYVVQKCLNRGRMEFVRLEFAKDVMVQGRSIFLDRPTLGGIHETFSHRILQGDSSSAPIGGLSLDCRSDLAETTG